MTTEQRCHRQFYTDKEKKHTDTMLCNADAVHGTDWCENNPRNSEGAMLYIYCLDVNASPRRWGKHHEA